MHHGQIWGRQKLRKERKLNENRGKFKNIPEIRGKFLNFVEMGEMQYA